MLIQQEAKNMILENLMTAGHRLKLQRDNDLKI
jgi:hypothetical protein